MGYNGLQSDIDTMGRKKEKTKQVAIRLPESLHEFVDRRSYRLHGGDFTAALIELLSQAKEVIIKHDGWIAERQIIEWTKEYEEKGGKEKEQNNQL